MQRRRFITGGILASTFAGSTFGQAMAKNTDKNEGAFNLKYAPHFGMFKHHAGEDPIDELKFMSEQGFTAMEDNGMKGRKVALQEKIASQMTSSNMQMGVFVAHTIYWNEPSLTGGKQEFRDQFLKEIKESVEVAKRVNAQWMTVVPGHKDLRLKLDYQTANVVETLKMACEILEPHNLVMVLEPLNFRDHPGLFLETSPHAYEVCKAVDSPSCKILFDIYHQQITEGNLIPNIDLSWDEIGYFQIGDNPGRKEPTTGEINYLNVFKHIHDKAKAEGREFIMGMEHGNSKEGKEGEKAVIEAYRAVDKFM